MRDGALIWLANVLTFAAWYWQLDAHGPEYRRHHRYATLKTDFLFPQQTIDHPAWADWSPNFIDYLLMNFYSANADWPGHNWNAARRRAPGAGFVSCGARLSSRAMAAACSCAAGSRQNRSNA